MRNFSARETEWLLELDGIELASFWQRTFAFLIDWTFIVIVLSLVATLATAAYLGVRHLEGKPLFDVTQFIQEHKSTDKTPIVEKDFENGLKVKAERTNDSELAHIANDVVIPVLYFGILLWKGKGRTPGKRFMKIRVVSLMHRHITFWHSVERALGYGAAALELGFGFAQFFIHPYRRCAQDRLAETIVVTERGYQAMQHKLAHPLLPDTQANEAAPE
ncbi:MAG: RDD family protein [Acidobacteriota bacterium]